MTDTNDLTTGNVGKKLIRFAMPYLLAAFMQTFYGIADLFVVGIYNDASVTTAVSVGSQVMHMLTVIILGFAMGTTVHVGRCVGAKDKKGATAVVGTSVCFFAVLAVALVMILLAVSNGIANVMHTPKESLEQTVIYLNICFAGIPFIVFYNVISSIFRGAGDSKHPMIFVAIACVVNVVLDFVLIGGLGLGATGAALATIIGQAVSVLISLIAIRRIKLGFSLKLRDIKTDRYTIGKILKVGAPIALQDGMVQIAFIVITIIANSRGLIAAASVGIVEKIIGFMFLVPSAFLSAISAIVAQNMGAGKPERARKSLYYGLAITAFWGLFCGVYSQFLPNTLVGLFTKELPVLAAGCAYLKSYSFDAFFAAFHFCFSGYFCGDRNSMVSFVHNIVAIILVRIPGAYFFSKIWPDSLYPMGWAAPLGSLLSALICVGVYVYQRRTACTRVN
ncbi:MAG: MATE family efflux transporter [Lachnospiraceae bacterium]|nr:MATE family efflux transporter [Lachnospiraceae bacterium]